MKIKFFTSLSAALILLISSVIMGYAQTGAVKIDFDSPPPAGEEAAIQIPAMPEDTFAVRIPKTYRPSVIGSGAISLSRESSGSDFIFAFAVPSGMIPELKKSSNGLVITLKPGAKSAKPEQPEKLPVIQANYLVNPAVNSTVKTSSNPGSSGSGNSRGAQQTSPLASALKKIPVDYSVPESPGFTILGLTPQTVVRPSSPRDLATSLLNAVDKNGNFQTGVAIDTAPFMLFFGRNISIKDYRSNYLKQLLTRTQFSFATVKGTSDKDKSARLGAGASIVLFDNGDPRRDTELDQCFTDNDKAVSKERISPALGEDQIQAILDSRTAALKKGAEKCREAARERNWAKSSFGVGFAGSWISKDGRTGKFIWNGGAYWASLVYGFEGSPLNKKAQLIFHFRRRTREQIADPENTGNFLLKNSNFYGGRLRFGNPNLIGNAEVVYVEEKQPNQPLDKNYRLSFGAERRLASNLYLNFSIGGETKKRDGTNDKVFVTTGFNWGTSKEPTTVDK